MIDIGRDYIRILLLLNQILNRRQCLGHCQVVDFNVHELDATHNRLFPQSTGTTGCGPANKKSLVNVIARVSSVQCAAIRDIRYHKLRIASKFRKLRNCYKGVMRYKAGNRGIWAGIGRFSQALQKKHFFK